MQGSNPIYVSDSTSIIVLSKIGKLHILQRLFHEIHVPRAVYAELMEATPGKIDPSHRDGTAAIKSAHWIKVRDVVDRALVQRCLATLDPGESESIALAKQLNAELLIIDERKGRKLAEELNIKIIGTLGVVVKAKQNGILSEVKSTIQQMTSLQNPGGFYVSADVIAQILKLAGE
jgi:uncharacterized protein